jgi:putative ABC transport system permease protein
LQDKPPTNLVQIDYGSPKPGTAPQTPEQTGLFIASLVALGLGAIAVGVVIFLAAQRVAVFGGGLSLDLSVWIEYINWLWFSLAAGMLLLSAVLAGIRAATAGRFYAWLTRFLTNAQWAAVAIGVIAFVLTIDRSLRLSREAEWKKIELDWDWLMATLLGVALFALLVFFKAALSGDAGIVLKQMRQRALGTWLTLLSVLLGVALAMAVLLINRESGRLFGQTDFGYDLVIGPPKGSKLTLILNTVYHMEQSEGVIPYSLYEEMAAPGTDYGKQVRAAVPFMVGDSFKGRRIVGTSPQMIGYDDAGKRMDRPWQYRRDRSFELAQGKPFHPLRFEAVIGSQLAADLGLHLYDPPRPGETPEQADERNLQSGGAFKATHGMPAEGETPDIHKPKWRIVGILQPTGTANDRVLFVPVISLYAINEHSSGMIAQEMLRKGIDPRNVTEDRLPEIGKQLGFDVDKIPKSTLRKLITGRSLPPGGATRPATKPADTGGELLKGPGAAPPAEEEEEPDAYHLDEHGNIVVDLPRDEWALSAILVKTRAAFMTESMLYQFKVVNTEAQAAAPARVMREFFDTFLKGTTYILLAVAALVSVVAAVSILVSIYNSVSARQKEIAILRALGATRGKVLSLICLEAGAIGLVGGLLGFVAGHALGALGSVLAKKVFGEGIEWWVVDRNEILYLAGVFIVAVLAGLVPALKAYRVPVVTNLVAG